MISGYSIGGLDPLNPPGLCEVNLSVAALNAETTFGVVIGNQTAAIGCNCLLGEGTEPTIFELFNEGLGMQEREQEERSSLRRRTSI